MADYPFHPLAQDYPLLEGPDFEAFADDIARQGLRVPIRLWQGSIIDGRNRDRACRARNVRPWYVDDTPNVAAADLEAHIASLNEHRRHLTAEFLRGRREGRNARILEASRAGMSERAIAEQENVSKTQVRRVVEQSGGPGGPPDTPEIEVATSGPDDGPGGPGGPPETAPPKVTGRDGKRYPAKRSGAPRKPRAPKAEDNGEAPPSGSTGPGEPVEPPTPRDALGIPIPDPLAPAFAAREGFAAALSLRRKLVVAVNELAQTAGGVHLAQDLSRREVGGKVSFRSTQLEDLKTLLEGNAPHSCVCPYCHDHHPGRVDPACRACHGQGWVTLRTWRQAPREERSVVETLGKESAP